MKKLTCSKKKKKICAFTFSKFYGLKYLQAFYGIRTTRVIQRLAQLKANCSNLRKHFNYKEIEQVNILIYLLISKNRPSLNQIINEFRNRSLPIRLNKKIIKSAKQSSTSKSHKLKDPVTSGTKIQVYKNLIEKIKRNRGTLSFRGLQMYEE